MPTKHFFILSAIVASVVALFLILSPSKKQPVSRAHVHTVHTFEMSDGSRAFQGTDGFWYWYLFGMMHESSGDSQTWTRQNFSPTSYPVAGVKVSTEKDEAIEELEEETVPLGEEALAAVAEETVTPEAEEPSEATPSTEAEPSTESPSSSEPASSEPSSDSSSSSDSGGGDSD
jgi:hypothetical protein